MLRRNNISEGPGATRGREPNLAVSVALRSLGISADADVRVSRLLETRCLFCIAVKGTDPGGDGRVK